MSYEQIRTPQFTLCFPSVFVPRAANPGQDPKYSVMALFPKNTDLTALQRIVRAAAEEKWGKNLPANLNNPFRDGDTQAKPEWGEVFRGMWFIRLTSKYKPVVVDVSKRDITDPEKVYGGQKAVAVVHAYAYNNSGNLGVAFGLDAIQIVAEGEHLGYSKEAVVAQFEEYVAPEPSITDMFEQAPQQAPAPGGWAPQQSVPTPRPTPQFSSAPAPMPQQAPAPATGSSSPNPFGKY